MKYTEWIVVIVVMAMFLSFVGIPTGLDPILQYVGVNITNSQLVTADIENSTIWDYLLNPVTGVLIAIVGATAVIGFFAKSYDTSLVILPVITTTIGIFIVIFGSTIKYIIGVPGVQSWMIAIVAIIIVGLAVAFIASALDYFAGR